MEVALIGGCALRALGLRSLLEAEGHAPIWIAYTAADARSLCSLHSPARLLFDFTLPGSSGPRLLHCLRHKHPALEGAVILKDPHPAFLALAWRAGARAAFLNGFFPSFLCERLRAFLKGAASWSPGTAQAAQERWTHYGIPWASLSTRQRAVARGWSDKEIAQALGLRPSSIHTHLNRIHDRLGSGRSCEPVSVDADGTAGPCPHRSSVGHGRPSTLEGRRTCSRVPGSMPKRSLSDRWEVKPTG
ncbi:MAG: response regulator transcription factor [Anaerolineae bacterium]|nr:response regulator transcription factor [Thermoflexus sp.]MDW8064118.1 response regulator transcription factor [Anaerolineae bacterium]